MENKRTAENEKSILKAYPNNFEAEKAVLCCIMIDGAASKEILMQAVPDYFYNERNRRIFQAALKLGDTHKATDMVTVYDMLDESKMTDITMLEYLNELISFLPSAANYKEYLDILRHDMLLRGVINTCNEIIEDAYGSNDADRTLNLAAQKIHDISSMEVRGGLEHISKASAEFLHSLEELLKNKNARKGLTTYFKKLDSVTNGFQRGDLIILAARPSVGKTSFALNVVSNLIENSEKEKTVAIFSLEMPAVQLVQRLFSTLTDITMTKLSVANIDNRDMQKLWDYHARMANCNIYIDQKSSQTPGETYMKCQRLRDTVKKKIDLVIIDYLQFMVQDTKDRRASDNKNTEVSDISRKLKQLARDMDCPVVVLSQMARDVEKRDDSTPRLSDLRDSGAIEQDADIVMFLSRENKEDNGKPAQSIILKIAKHRNGALCDIRYIWEGDNVRFSESPNQYFTQ